MCYYCINSWGVFLWPILITKTQINFTIILLILIFLDLYLLLTITGCEYVSVNHFPRSLFRVYKMDNELYDFNTNKICFILDDIIPLE